MHVAGIFGRFALRGIRSKLVIAGTIAVIGLATPGAALADSGVHCASSATYGSQCIDVFGSHLQVTDIQTWFMTPNSDFLSGKKWRINLERYDCDPVGVPKSQCGIVSGGTWQGNTRSGNPPVGGSTCVSVSFDGAYTVEQCRNDGMAYADGSNGYWSGFGFTHKFTSNVWLCTELQIYNSSTGKWVYNAAGLKNGLRACVSVHD